jgi:transposase-like protein
LADVLSDDISFFAGRPDMPKQKQHKKQNDNKTVNLPLSFFACPNSDCADFNKFDANNLSIAEWMGKNKAIRRLYCKTCGTRFSERQGSLMQYTKLPQADVVRIVKCLGHGCSIEATADICEVDARTVQRLLEKAGKRAVGFHRLQLENLEEPLEAVQMDELHGKTVKDKRNSPLVDVPKKLRKRLSTCGSPRDSLRRAKKRAGHGCIRLWP